MKKDEIQKTVRERYGKIAGHGESGCCCGPASPATSCCGPGGTAADIGRMVGYSDEDLNAVPEGANLGLGCGNPVALASLEEGETVLDLGSGAGFDCFLAASRVGENGKVIGVDMTAGMLDRARDNARKGGYRNVEFRLGEIENLPVADDSVDAVISNCVINLSGDKQRVFDEAFRVLAPGGRLMVSDIVILQDLPEPVRNSIDAYIGCVAGAVKKDEYLAAVRKSGFEAVAVVEESTFSLDCVVGEPLEKAALGDLKLIVDQVRDVSASIVSVKVRAIKPLKAE